MKAHKAGFFRELSHGDEYGPKLQDSIQSQPQRYEEKIIKYLESGIVFIACMGSVGDVLNPSKEVNISPHILTDGVWVWPADLSYYVNTYHAKLDSKFIEHMITVDWQMVKEELVDFDNLEFPTY